jgi:hypothetical protein
VLDSRDFFFRQCLEEFDANNKHAHEVISFQNKVNGSISQLEMQQNY